MAWESPLLTTHTHWLGTPAWRPRSHRTELPPEPQQTPLQAPGAGPELGEGRRPRGLPAGGAAHRASKQQRGRQGFEGAWGKGGKEREGPGQGAQAPPKGGASVGGRRAAGRAAQEAADQVGSSRSNHWGARAEPVNKDPPETGEGMGGPAEAPQSRQLTCPSCPLGDPLSIQPGTRPRGYTGT